MHQAIRTITYYLAIPFIYLLAVIPFGILYGISDITFFLLFYIVRYRRSVVRENLVNAFPEKSNTEIATIERRFYRFLCDLLLETFKTLTISRQEMLRRCSMDQASRDMLQRLADQHESVILVLGHFGNWEWGGNTFSLCSPHRALRNLPSFN
ncbi:MAG: hypothetical protein QM743_13985 [Chitinophagaceae bacterium]